MRRIFFVTIFAIGICRLTGCGYTIIRDLDEEARLAESAAIDSLKSGPDLTISHIYVDYVPPPGRRDPMDQGVYPASVHFMILVRNIGTTSFDKPFLLVMRNLYPRPDEYRTIGGFMRNRRGEIIPAMTTELVELPLDQPRDSTTFEFTIVTNPLVQVRAIQELQRHEHTSPPQLSRELHYDNNTALITIQGRKSMLEKSQHE